jgi:hypothetical protein
MMAGALELPLESDLHRFVSVRGVNLPEAARGSADMIAPLFKKKTLQTQEPHP